VSVGCFLVSVAEVSVSKSDTATDTANSTRVVNGIKHFANAGVGCP
jgi:hypothetical protein